mmetsp:Transcript_42699/g.166855  ORF Transcript_42699/g.166855 Transcript_42699/m.166855 type:complete len:97 (+) Transcript_42699:710-1000(+)
MSRLRREVRCEGKDDPIRCDRVRESAQFQMKTGWLGIRVCSIRKKARDGSAGEGCLEMNRDRPSLSATEPLRNNWSVGKSVVTLSKMYARTDARWQ